MHVLVRLVIICGLSITFYDNLITYYKLHLKTPVGRSNEVYCYCCLMMMLSIGLLGVDVKTKDVYQFTLRTSHANVSLMDFQFLKTLWCCVCGRVKQKSGFIKRVEKG